MATKDRPQLAIDTDIVIDYLRRRSTVMAQAIEQFDCALTAIPLYELMAVAVRSPQQAQRLGEFRTVLSILPFDEAASIVEADIWRNLQSKGTTSDLPDILIAGICLAHELPLLTRNARHYERVPDLKLLQPEDL